ncbi:PPE domain-containing protein [Nocardia sp. NPDC004722]
MVLRVNPQDLAGIAGTLSQLAAQVHSALPTDAVMPAGADADSAAAAALYNLRAASVTNEVVDLLNGLASHADRIRAAAVDYVAADEEGARKIGVGGGVAITNPVAGAVRFAPRPSPPPPVLTEVAVDPLTFAQQLQSGPGPGPARDYARLLRRFTDHARLDAVATLDDAMRSLHKWTPVGTMAAEHVGNHRARLTQAADQLDTLAADVDNYAAAFAAVKARHPLPEEISKARERLLASLRSNNQAEKLAALEHFHEVNARSARSATEYTGKVGTAQTPGDDPKQNPNGNGGSGNGDSSTMMQMLPALLSSMSGLNGLQQHEMPSEPDTTVPDDSSFYPFENLPNIPSFAGGGPAIPAVDTGYPVDEEIPQVPMGGLPSVPAVATGAGLPRAPVIDALSNGNAVASANRGGAGSPYMPYMPMSPGATGGAGGNERKRVVAWHPDRLICVDDTPYIDAVIGEKPTIAPTPTPPTPAPQGPAHSGGSV